MLPAVAVLLLALPPDTLPYADAATERLVTRAVATRAAGDAGVRDYTARVTYRLTYGASDRRHGPVRVASVEEQEARVRWQRPDDLRIDILGKRFRTRLPSVPATSLLEEPWFVPYETGDSLRVLFSGFPERAAVHPLGRGAAAWYRYRLVDSLAVRTPQGERRFLQVEVVPARRGAVLVAGRLWLDAATAQLVRLTVRFGGDGAWAVAHGRRDRGGAEAALLNAVLDRSLTLDVDLEYALEDGAWVPHRQVVGGRVALPLAGRGALVFEFRTTFRDVQVNTGVPIEFDVPLPDSAAEATLRGPALDALRRVPPDPLGRRQYAGRGGAGGRWQIRRVAVDSLWRRYAWEAPLALDDAGGDADAGLRAGVIGRVLGRGLDATGADAAPPWVVLPALRFDRVQGAGLGLAARGGVGVPWVTLALGGRVGTADGRVTGGVELAREAPGGRWALAGWRDVRTLDPFALQRGATGLLSAFVFGRDDADWHLGTGARFAREQPLGRVTLHLEAGVERVASVTTRQAPPLFGVAFPENPTVRGGFYTVGAVQLGAPWGLGGWRLRLEGGQGADVTVGRATASATIPLDGVVPRGSTLRVQAGGVAGADTPQWQLRAGGAGTVRGFTYGVQRGTALWSVGADVPLSRGFWWRPVVFADAGRASAAGDLLRGPVLVGGGAGLELAGGALRLDVSHPVTPRPGGVRMDLYVAATPLARALSRP